MWHNNCYVPEKGEIMGRWMKKIKNKQYGQAMVEFALTLPIFLLLVLGVIELSRFFLVYSSVFTASREATRYGSSVGEDDINPNYSNCSEIALRAQQSGFFGGVNSSDVVIYYEQKTGTKIGDCGSYKPVLGDRVVVEVSAIYDPLLIGFVIPEGIEVSSTNGRTIMKQIAVEATPKPVPVCSNDVDFLTSNLVQDTNNKKILYIDVINYSSYSNYRLDYVKDITWDNSDDKVYLEYIHWGGVEIWSEEASTDEPPIDITNFDSESTQNLPAEFTKRIEFIFTKNIPAEFAITFNMKFVNASDSNNFCIFNMPEIE